MSAVTMQSVIESHAWQWRQRMMEYILPRLNCSPEEKQTVFDMIWAAVDQGRDEGMADAVYLVSRVKIGATTARDRHVIGIVEKSLAELKRRNAKSADAALIEETEGVDSGNSGEKDRP